MNVVIKCEIAPLKSVAVFFLLNEIIYKGYISDLGFPRDLLLKRCIERHPSAHPVL